MIFAGVYFMIAGALIGVSYSFTSSSPEYEMACLFIGWIFAVIIPYPFAYIAVHIVKPVRIF